MTSPFLRIDDRAQERLRQVAGLDFKSTVHQWLCQVGCRQGDCRYDWNGRVDSCAIDRLTPGFLRASDPLPVQRRVPDLG